MITIFVPAYRYRGSKTWNKVGPFIMYIFAQFSGIIVPVIILIYFIGMIFTGWAKDCVLFPWILASTLIQFWTATYTYFVIVRSTIDAVR